MHPITRFLRYFFHHLYHGFAWTYDIVSGTVSFGNWNDWVRAVIPLIRGKRVLELGHGPGHLQMSLQQDPSLFAVGLDESPQMGRLASARLRRVGLAKIRLVRAPGQCLPFPAATFDTVVSTFPSEYIFDRRTLSEVKRTLKNDARLIVLPVAWPKNRILAWLFRVTRQSPAEVLEVAKSKLTLPFVEAGFKVEVRTLDVKSGILLIILAT
jgi:ubiquinone/menaquinone biosynthesis C-methylase UbiE